MSTVPPSPSQTAKVLSEVDTPEFELNVTANPPDQVSDLLDLTSGKELSESSALSLAESRHILWIVIAGQVDSGKTTLLTSLYDMFQWSAISGLRFAGSTTLPAFEQRCHLSRAASERVVPDTNRTPYSPNPTYLHLKVSPVSDVPFAVDFLFTDVSGEMFEHARNSTTDCQELRFLRRAAAFVLILDGEKAVRPDRRWAMVEEAQGLLQSCLDSSMIADGCKVAVIWSKGDILQTANETDELNTFREEVERGFRASFSHRLSHLAFGEIAARPTKAPYLGFGKGLPELLANWVEATSEKEPMSLFPESLKGTRESELFAFHSSEVIKA